MANDARYIPQAYQPQGYNPPTQSYVPQPQGYTSQPQGYVPSPQGYTSQPQGYVPSSQGYVPLSQGYIAPPSQVYIAPPAQSYNAPPSQGYIAPPAQSYNAPPSQGYIAPPAQSYNAPSSQGYALPPQGYTATPQSYASQPQVSTSTKQTKPSRSRKTIQPPTSTQAAIYQYGTNFQMPTNLGSQGETSITMMERNVNLWNGNPAQINALINLVYKGSNKNIIDVQRKDVYLEILNLLKNHGFESIYQFLSQTKNPDDILFNRPDLSYYQSDIDREIYIQQEDMEPVKGVAICAKCKGEEVTYLQKQTRGGDEPMTTFFTCQNRICGNKWRVG